MNGCATKDSGKLLLCISSGANILLMNNILSIRKRLGLQQTEFAEEVGVTQSNVSHYENGRNDPSPAIGLRVVALAQRRGVVVTLEEVFSAPEELESSANQP